MTYFDTVSQGRGQGGEKIQIHGQIRRDIIKFLNKAVLRNCDTASKGGGCHEVKGYMRKE